MDKLEEVLTRGVDKIYPSKDKLSSLMKKRKIKLYWGVDPTGEKLHIGHAVALRKLKQFQDLGHHVIFLIGDFTAMVGDPSGKSTSRPMLSREEVLKNAKGYKEQASKIINFDGENPVEIKFNSEWLAKMSALEFFRLAKNLSLAQVAERDLFQKRIKEGQDLFMNEFLYPFMQGYDSVAMNIDLEIGGTDQTFNMLIGRKLMRNISKKEKFVMTLPLLTDGQGKKIGKSEGNAIGLTDKPNDFYAKIMSLSDDAIANCFKLLTDKPLPEIEKIESEIKTGKNQLKYKKQLAFDLTSWLNSKEDAEMAQENFSKTFQEKKPEYNEEIAAGNIIDSLEKILGSKSEVKRLIKQGGVDINGNKAASTDIKLRTDDKINLGKRKFLIVK